LVVKSQLMSVILYATVSFLSFARADRIGDLALDDGKAWEANLKRFDASYTSNEAQLNQAVRLHLESAGPDTNLPWPCRPQRTPPAKGLHVDGASPLHPTDHRATCSPEAIVRTHERIKHTWEQALIPDKAHTHGPDGDEGFNLLRSAPRSEWLILACVCATLALIDMMFLQRLPSTFRAQCVGQLFLTCITISYGIALWARTNRTVAMEWFSGYMLEWLLSLDNLFLFHLVLNALKTPARQLRKAVFFGIIWAVCVRLVFFMVISKLLHICHWLRIGGGLALIWSGIKAARDGGDDTKVEDTWIVRNMKWLLGSRFHEGFDEQGNQAFIRASNGKLQATVLVLAVASVECTDMLFALDSVIAKVAQVPNQYIAFSSTAMAIFGVRSAFFTIKELVSTFELLQYGLCEILVFMGLELTLADYITVKPATVCVLFASIVTVSVSASTALQSKRSRTGSDVVQMKTPSNVTLHNPDIQGG